MSVEMEKSKQLKDRWSKKEMDRVSRSTKINWDAGWVIILAHAQRSKE